MTEVPEFALANKQKKDKKKKRKAEEVFLSETAPVVEEVKKSKKNKKAKTEAVTVLEPIVESEAPKKSKKAKKDKIDKKDKKDETDSAESKITFSQTTSPEDEAYRSLHFITLGDKNSAVLPSPLKTFDSLPFLRIIIASLKKGFQAPSPIQAQGWPVALNGNDLIAIAKTGSGKTLAFLLPIVHKIISLGLQNFQRGPDCVILAPTRELVQQIKAELDKFAMAAGVKSVCIYGGAPIAEQKAELKTHPHVVVATPGRLVDLLSQSPACLALRHAKLLGTCEERIPNTL